MEKNKKGMSLHCLHDLSVEKKEKMPSNQCFYLLSEFPLDFL